MPSDPGAVAGETVPASVAIGLVDAIGAAAVQVCGADNDPTRAARPVLAEAAAPMPAPPKFAKPAGPDVRTAEASQPGAAAAAALPEEDRVTS
jgi:hypothetical protein